MKKYSRQTLWRLHSRSAASSEFDLFYSTMLDFWRVFATKSAGVSSDIENVLSLLRQTRVRIPCPSELRSYLAHHPDMISKLLPVCGIVRGFLKTQAQLSLELYTDPEVQDEYLTLYVRQENYDADIIDDLDRAFEQCRELLENSSGWLIVTTDFQSPE